MSQSVPLTQQFSQQAMAQVASLGPAGQAAYQRGISQLAPSVERSLMSAAATPGSQLRQDIQMGLPVATDTLRSQVLPTSQQVVNVPLNQSPLSAAALTGLIPANAPVAITSVPEGSNVVVSTPVSRVPSPRRSTRASQIPMLPQAYDQKLEPVLASLPPLGGGTVSSPPMMPMSPVRQMSPRSALRSRISRNVTPQVSPILGAQASSYQELMKMNTNDELARAGYTVINQFSVREDKTDTIRASYVKAIDRNGRTVYILLDDTGYTSVNPADLTEVDAKIATQIPDSLKRSVYQQAGTGVGGVVFECPNGICSITRNPQMEAVESSFILVSKKAETSAVMGTDPVAHPVVRLSEIRANPSAVLLNTEAASSKIRNSQYTDCVEQLKRDEALLRELNESFNRYHKTRNEAKSSLESSIAQLTGYNNIYNNPKYVPVTSADASNKETTHRLLMDYNAKVPLLMSSCKAATAISKPIMEATSILNQLTELIKKEFSGLNNVNK